MNAVILCPGPSLAMYYGGGDLVLGVNRAATLHPCDVWVALDWRSRGEGIAAGGVEAWARHVIGNPRLVIGRDGNASLHAHNIPWRGDVCEIESWWDGYKSVKGWSLYSATTALMYAHHRGATTIETYGVDWSGANDWDGVLAGGTRTEQRWERERNIWGGVAGYLEQQGTKVKRYGIAG
jgi:hypothetical protein